MMRFEMKKGFTIVELLMVVGIIAVLMTITVTAIKGAVHSTRTEKAKAVCKMVQQGLLTYKAQKGEFPSGIINGSVQNDGYYWAGKNAKQAVYELVKEAHEGNPMMDISGLVVAKDENNAGEPGSNATPRDFFAATRSNTKKGTSGMRASEMVFGYPNSDGKFRRFVIKYHPQSDRLIVRQFTDAEERTYRKEYTENEGTYEYGL